MRVLRRQGVAAPVAALTAQQFVAPSAYPWRRGRTCLVEEGKIDAKDAEPSTVAEAPSKP